MIETKMLRLKAAYFSLRQRGEEITQRGEKINVSANIGACSMSNGILIENQKFVTGIYSRKLGAKKFQFFLFFSFFDNPFSTAGLKRSLTSVDLPDPDTPVMHVKTLKGISIEMFLRLCMWALRIDI